MLKGQTKGIICMQQWIGLFMVPAVCSFLLPCFLTVIEDVALIYFKFLLKERTQQSTTQCVEYLFLSFWTELCLHVCMSPVFMSCQKMC